MDAFWMVVDISQSEPVNNGERLPILKAPRFMHPEQDRAEKELLRLQQRYPDSEFVLLEAVAFAKVDMVPKISIQPTIRDGIPF